jgi:ketosteroid isomerase-like protein
VTEQTTDQTQLLVDQAEIRRIVDGIDDAVDAKDWELCRSYFTDEIYVDFTSLAGGSPGSMAADDLVGAWNTNLYAAKGSFHMRTNHRIAAEGDRAEVVSKGYALNILQRNTGSELWEVWGIYTHTLERTAQGWKCSGMSLAVTHARGNEKVREFVPEQ